MPLFRWRASWASAMRGGRGKNIEVKKRDKNPISSLVSERKEIRLCEQGEVDWTEGGQNRGHPDGMGLTRPSCMASTCEGEPDQDTDLFCPPVIMSEVL